MFSPVLMLACQVCVVDCQSGQNQVREYIFVGLERWLWKRKGGAGKCLSTTVILCICHSGVVTELLITWSQQLLAKDVAGFHYVVFGKARANFHSSSHGLFVRLQLCSTPSYSALAVLHPGSWRGPDESERLS